MHSSGSSIPLDIDITKTPSSASNTMSHTKLAEPPPPLKFNNDYGQCLDIPPFDNTYLSEQDFDFSIQDLLNDSNLDPFDPTRFPTHPDFSNSEASSPSRAFNNLPNYFHSDVSSCFKVESPENFHVFVDCGSQESNGSNKGLTGTEESQGSGKSVTSSPNFDKNSIKNGVVEQGISLDGYVKNEVNYADNVNCDSKKRKKGSEDCSNSDSEGGTNPDKHRKSSDSSCNDGGDNVDITPEEEVKRKARLERNRESAQLSRQRKKQYVEELEDKVRTMHSTIQELNAKISYIIAENASLKQQMGGGVGQSSVAPPPGMYPPPPMMYPWMHAPPYMMKPQGSQVPLVPIPRLKSRQVASAPKNNRKAENKKSEGRTKKVASVSFLGLLFFMLIFGGLVPMVNVRYKGENDSFMGRSVLVEDGHYEQHHGRVLTVNRSGYGETFSKAHDINSKFNCAPRDNGGGERSSKYGGYESVGAGNGSEPLMASLYVPRNDKLVKIDGNLIIHSILASEKATTPREDQLEKKIDGNGLAILGDLVPSDPRRNAETRRHLALGSGVESEKIKATAADRQLQQWFRQGLAGPMLSSGRCTEVFQFDVVSASAPGSIISATSSRNVSTTNSKNSTHVSKGRNRRILHGRSIPLPGSSAHSVSEESTGRETGNGSLPGTNSSSSMVVSVLMDPREAGDAEGDGVMGPKSLSRIFVVVLVDGVKYVTYSCMFPFKGAAVPHLVTG